MLIKGNYRVHAIGCGFQRLFIAICFCHVCWFSLVFAVLRVATSTHTYQHKQRFPGLAQKLRKQLVSAYLLIHIVDFGDFVKGMLYVYMFTVFYSTKS